MTLVYTHENLALVMNMNTLLEQAGVKTQIKNEFAAGGRGEIPCFETWPEVWVLQDNHVEKAKRLVREVIEKQNKPDWVCLQCGEENGSAFEFCWQCDTLKPVN